MNKTDYAELLFPKRPAMKPNHGVLPNNPAHMNSSTHLKVAEDIPPALPHRPSTLSDPAGPPRNTSKPPVSPNTPSPLRLYPCLETELNALSFQTPSMVKTLDYHSVYSMCLLGDRAKALFSYFEW